MKPVDVHHNERRFELITQRIRERTRSRRWMENRAIRIPISAGATRTAALHTNNPVSPAPNPSPATIITIIYTRSQRIITKKTVADSANPMLLTLNIPATKRPNPAPPSWRRCCTLSRATHLHLLLQQPPRLHLRPNHLSSPLLPPPIIHIPPSSSSSRTALRRRQMIKSGMRWWPTSRASRGPPRSHRSSRSSRRATRPTTRPRSSPRHRRLAPTVAAPPLLLLRRLLRLHLHLLRPSFSDRSSRLRPTTTTTSSRHCTNIPTTTFGCTTTPVTPPPARPLAANSASADTADQVQPPPMLVTRRMKCTSFSYLFFN